ncbi:GerAB/ArcD/ProY family transporter [Ureibacillus acetophenoni]|uniref:Spore germination protein n=1 Tax=Ureibacillus acetophenoni TaxID=614649 RepID=A0A285UHI9_9BACL|nr:endospore germination permease [Ureibacillus acetophenoni]SOC39711.1 spore germination protein [Ureibacillus acetophenoni]
MKPTLTHGFISDRDIMITVTTNIIGITTLTFPRIIAEDTSAADGWVPILIGGCIACFLAWLIAKIASSFPNQSFFNFTSYLLSKPIAVIISVLFILHFILVSSYQVREVSVLAHQYLFDKTPIQVISLSFLLVVVYGVAGSRAGIFRLIVLFYPTVIVGLLLLTLLPIGLFKLENLLPIFQTDFEGYLRASYSGVHVFLGFSIILFYIEVVKEPKNTPKMAIKGILIAVIFSLFLFLVCVGTFGNATTSNLFFPSFDLSRAVEIPGGFFERFDVIVFVIWTMILFTTTLISFDLVILLMMMLFKKANKMKLIYFLSPLVFLLSSLPVNYIELTTIGRFLSNSMLFLIILITILLGITYKVKGGNQN